MTNAEVNNYYAHVLTREQVIKRLRSHSKKLGSQRALARAIGIEASHLSDILAGKRGPGPKVQRYLRLERREIYVPSKRSVECLS